MGKVLTSDASGVGTWQPVSLVLPYAQTGSSAGPALFEITNSGDSPAIRGVSSSPTGTGIMGRYDHATGSGSGVYGSTTSPDGAGVTGVMGASIGKMGTNSALPPPWTVPTGVWGAETSGGLGFGVVGSTTGQSSAVVGWADQWYGVYGYSQSRAGVIGYSETEEGVYGFSDSVGVRADGGDIGLYATTGPSGVGLSTGSGTSSGTALHIRNGGLSVTNAGINTSTFVFTHRASASTIIGNFTIIDNPFTNGDPNAILIITPNWNPQNTGGTYNNHATGVYYYPPSQKWTIFNQDGISMPAGAAFNVLVIKSGSSGMDGQLPESRRERPLPANLKQRP
ncbi:MAG TPA: hypothetical protein PKA27_06465 [Fimbriimonadaceae bacterium]|nr:hypothetical protein [Fimbriimonadaceae bacterium]